MIDDSELEADGFELNDTTPLCFDCKHFDRDARHEMRCKAFPAEIPPDILLWRHDHHEPYPGDNGIRFEPIEP